MNSPTHRIWIWFADNGNIRKWQREPFAEGTEFIAALVPADVAGLCERLAKRAAEDEACAANSKIVADLLSPEMAKFEERNAAGWNTYAVRMAVEHHSSVERDLKLAATQREAATVLQSQAAVIAAKAAEIERLRGAAQRYFDATKEYFSAAEYDRNGVLAEADAALFVLLYDAARARSLAGGA